MRSKSLSRWRIVRLAPAHGGDQEVRMDGAGWLVGEGPLISDAVGGRVIAHRHERQRWSLGGSAEVRA